MRTLAKNSTKSVNWRCWRWGRWDLRWPWRPTLRCPTRATRVDDDLHGFVLLMSVPALGLFYGGLVRTKNMLSVLMQVFVGFSLITVLWCVYGYSLAFTQGNAFIGGFSRLFLNGTFDPANGAYSLVGAPSARARPCMSWCTSPSRRRSLPSPAA